MLLGPTIRVVGLKCCYYLSSEFKINLSESIADDYFSIFQINCRSQMKHGDSLHALLHYANSQFDIIAITETWLKSHDLSPSFPDYIVIRKDRVSSSGGGLLLFIRDIFAIDQTI